MLTILYVFEGLKLLPLITGPRAKRCRSCRLCAFLHSQLLVLKSKLTTHLQNSYNIFLLIQREEKSSRIKNGFEGLNFLPQVTGLLGLFSLPPLMVNTQKVHFPY